jgi:hypothetical protein
VNLIHPNCIQGNTNHLHSVKLRCGRKGTVWSDFCQSSRDACHIAVEIVYSKNRIVYKNRYVLRERP